MACMEADTDNTLCAFVRLVDAHPSYTIEDVGRSPSIDFNTQTSISLELVKGIHKHNFHYSVMRKYR